MRMSLTAALLRGRITAPPPPPACYIRSVNRMHMEVDEPEDLLDPAVEQIKEDKRRAKEAAIKAKEVREAKEIVTLADLMAARKPSYANSLRMVGAVIASGLTQKHAITKKLDEIVDCRSIRYVLDEFVRRDWIIKRKANDKINSAVTIEVTAAGKIALGMK